MRIGVLALQGGAAEHIAVLQQLGVTAVNVRLPAQLKALDGLIIPGGESTTIRKLVGDIGLIGPLRKFGESHAIWGTCAGAILLAKRVCDGRPLLAMMDIAIRRNAFGSQLYSFESDLDVTSLKPIVDTDGSYRAIFIRAPVIEAVTGAAKSLATLPDGRIVAAQQGRLLATSFHPELTDDTRFHAYFLALCKSTASV